MEGENYNLINNNKIFYFFLKFRYYYFNQFDIIQFQYCNGLVAQEY